MAADGTHSFYDIEPLLPFIERGYTVLTPNLRLARRVRKEWDRRKRAAGESCWHTLPVESLDNWLMNAWQLAVEQGAVPPRQVLTSAQLNELWLCVISEVDGGLNLLRPSAAAALAQQARDTLLRWRVDPGVEAVKQVFELDDDCRTFLTWLRAFEDRLQQNDLATPADCQLELLESRALPGDSNIVLLEIDDLPPLSEQLIKQACNDLQRHVAKGRGGQIHPRAFSDQRAELAAMAGWAAAIHGREPTATVGLVLPDMAQSRYAIEYLLRQEFGCLGSNYTSLPVNFSTGIRLQQAPLIRDAFRVIELAGPEIPLASFVALLQSRYTSIRGSDDNQVSRLVHALYDNGQVTLPTAELRYQVTERSPEGLEPLIELLIGFASRRELRRDQFPSEWLVPLHEVLQEAGWPGTGGLDSLEYQQLEQWNTLLEDFAAFDTISGRVSLAGALSLLRRLSADRISQPKTADSNVQVLGTLEANGLQFDYLWIAGMQASVWPAPTRACPLLPLSLQRQHDMPHSSAEREWRFASRMMASFQRHCGELIASYSEQVDGVPELPSALLGPPEQIAPAADERMATPWMSEWEAGSLQQLPDNEARRVDDQEIANLKGGSSLVENHASCPFRSFARHRLLVEPLAEPAAALTAAERGSMLHEALFVLWGDLGGSAELEALDVTSQAQLCQRASAAGIKKLGVARQRQVGRQCLELEEQRLQALLDEWLAVERQREEGFVVSGREQETSLDLDRLTLRLQVDRVDTLDGGGHVIIDYKSSASKLGDWVGERPAKPQLLLYGVAATDSPVALSFAQVRARECKFVGAGERGVAPGINPDLEKAFRGKERASDWSALNVAWRERLESLARSFLAGEASVDPLRPDSCTWCGLQPLCRVEVGPAGETST